MGCCRIQFGIIDGCICQVSVGLGVSLLRRAGLSRCASSHRRTGVSPLTGFQP
jgi:hypothetical protein